MLSKPLSKYLDREEAHLLKERLDSAEINSIITRQGLPRLLGGVSNYQVQIDPVNLNKAQSVLNEFKEEINSRRSEELHLLSTMCPICKSQNIYSLQKLSIIEKLIYFGVTVRRCKECGGQWYT